MPTVLGARGLQPLDHQGRPRLGSSLRQRELGRTPLDAQGRHLRVIFVSALVTAKAMLKEPRAFSLQPLLLPGQVLHRFLPTRHPSRVSALLFILRSKFTAVTPRRPLETIQRCPQISQREGPGLRLGPLPAVPLCD